ncbi:MAG TPA: 4Fe-4S binding protein [Planctomycetota bacterium]|nr:4Fe-4S binding protein [Planctomycetota bacterium]
MPVVREDVCTGCGKCVSECPVQVLRLTPKYNNVHVLCVSNDLGKNKIKAHRSGACIACGKCVQACPNQAISIENNVASIDYYKCTNCEECIAVCPTKAISNIRPITEKV